MNSRTLRLVLSGAVAATSSCGGAQASGQVYQSTSHDYRVTDVVTGLDHPWSLAFLPNGDMLVTEREGRLRLIRDGQLTPEPLQGVPSVHATGQGGLLDVVLHPEFSNNRLVYLSYSKPGAEATTAVIRGVLGESGLTDVEEIFEADARSGSDVHFGSRMVFDRQGLLYISIGERGEMDQAQNTANHQGTTLRLRDDGTVPEDNPFVGRSGYRPEIYTYGNRSPQGLAIHPTTGEIWQTEHGPRGGDELNLLLPGANYGWPVITYGINYNGTPITDVTEMEGMEQPRYYWVPSIATSGLAIYDGDAFPEWRGDFFVGGLAGAHLARVTLDGSGGAVVEPLLTDLGQRVRDVRNGPDGLLYVLLDERNSPLIRLEPVN